MRRSRHLGPGVKQHYKLHYVHSGEGWLRSNGREYHITAGQLFACFPGETVFYRADAAQPWEYSWVAFDGLNAEQYLRSPSTANISQRASSARPEAPRWNI